MNRVTHHKMWRIYYAKEYVGYMKCLHRSLFGYWNHSRMAEVMVWFELGIALDILYSGCDEALGLRFARRAVKIAQRALRERKFERGKFWEASFPQNRAYATLALSYARCLLGRPLDEAALLAAADDLLAFCKKEPWGHHQTQEHYLVAVRVRLIAGDAAGALALFKTRKRFPCHARQAALLQRVATAAVKGRPIRDATVRRAFEAWFNRIRSPKYQGRHGWLDDFTKERLEAALIRWRWFIAKQNVIDWTGVLRSVGR